MVKPNVQNILFFAVFIVLFIIVARLFWPFFSVLLWAAILFVILNPLYERISGYRRQKLGGPAASRTRQVFAAGFTAVFAVIVLVVPLGLLLFLLIRQAISAMSNLSSFLMSLPDSALLERFPEIRDILPEWLTVKDQEPFNLTKSLLPLIQSNQKIIISYSTEIARNVGGFVVALAFMIFTLYFFFLDGRLLMGLFVRAIPIKGSYMRLFINRFKETASQLVRGNLLVSLIQGIIAFLLFSLFKVDNALLLGVMVSICSFVPMVGASLVWIPISIMYILQKDPIWGAVLLVLSGVGISLLDNFYRPFLVGGPIKIHPLLIFFAIIGGISVFGFNGIIIGPLILAIFFTALDIFRELYEIPHGE